MGVDSARQGYVLRRSPVTEIEWLQAVNQIASEMTGNLFLAEGRSDLSNQAPLLTCGLMADSEEAVMRPSVREFQLFQIESS